MSRHRPKSHQHRKPPGIKWLNTNRTRRARLRDPLSFLNSPREGRGDYREPRVMRHGESHSDIYLPVRNGLPEPAEYQWRQPGWQQRARRNGLDLTAIAVADSELIGPAGKRQ